MTFSATLFSSRKGMFSVLPFGAWADACNSVSFPLTYFFSKALAACVIMSAAPSMPSWSVLSMRS